MRTKDVVLLDDGETWGGPGYVIRIPPNVLTKHQDEYDNGRLDEILDDPGTTEIDIDGLVAIYDLLRRLGVRNPALRKLLQFLSH